MAKQKVALDCLSYHAAANDDDTNTLAQAEVPKAEEFKLDRQVIQLYLQPNILFNTIFLNCLEFYYFEINIVIKYKLI